MSVFTRFRDIVSSNINAMLDRAEDPEKMIRLMIQEMEDTLVEIKASCASTMATRVKSARQLSEQQETAARWEKKATLAVQKGREDLAREALLEKRHHTVEVERLTKEQEQLDQVVGQYQEEIRQLEEKLQAARQKHRVLVERHQAATQRTRSQQAMRQTETSDAFLKFSRYENRIERMEADAEMVNYGRKPSTEDAFDALETDDALESELAELKSKVQTGDDKAQG